MRARGLKLEYEVIRRHLDLVAPHAGAWVETDTEPQVVYYDMSRPMRARGLKPIEEAVIENVSGRAPCGRVG